MDWVPLFLCPFFMFCPMLSLEEAPAFCCPQVRGGPLVVSLFLYVIHRNVTTLTDIVIKLYKGNLRKRIRSLSYILITCIRTIINKR